MLYGANQGTFPPSFLSKGLVVSDENNLKIFFS
jgi:hypothetical protein